MKKVLIIANDLFPKIGGAEKYINYLINLLSLEKFAIDIYISKYQSLTIKEQQISKYKNINIYYSLDFLKNKKYINLLNEPIIVKPFNVFKFIKKIPLLFFVYKKERLVFHKYFKENNYDLIIDNTENNYKCMRNKKNVIFVSHTNPFVLINNSKTKSSFFMNCFWLILKKVFKIFMSRKFYSNIVMCSEENKKDFEKYFKFQKNQRIFYCLNGVENVDSKIRYNPNNKIISILRFDNSIKNLSFMNEVSKNLNNSINVYGSGPDKFLLQNVVLHDPILDEQEKIKILSNSSIFIMTSTIEGGCPYSIIEAMSCGIPIVIRNTFANASYLVINNYNGLIFNKNDSPEIVAKAINELMSNKELLEKMHSNTIEYFNKNFKIDKFYENWKKIIYQIV
ncbi:MAG: glycosyltransferase family 4 protein, partial [Mycoplasmoidaceae bacterium]